MAPGARALAFASRWFEPALVHRTFEPLIADWQREWYESPPSRRAWVSVRAWMAFMCSAAISSPGIIATPTPRAISLSVANRVAVFSLIAAVAISIPMARSVAARWLDAPLWAAVLLMALPMALAIAFPFAMVIAVDAIRRAADVSPHVERAAAVKLALFAMLMVLSINGVVIPLANQEFRELATPPGWNVPQPQMREHSTFALLTHPERRQAIVPGQYTRAGEIRRELITRTVLSVMPAIYVWLRWSALGKPRRRRYWPLPGGLMTALVVVVFWMTANAGSILEYNLWLPPGSALFVPLAAFASWSLVEQRLAHGAMAAQAA
jgi:hypothetical protein